MFRIPSWQSLVFCYSLALVSATGQERVGQAPALLNKTLQKNYAIRFVYNPPVPQNNVVKPTTFRQVETEDPRFDTWSTEFPLGLTMWLSPEETKRLAGGLAELNLIWTESEKPMVFQKEPKEPPDPHWRWKVVMPRREGTLEIDVTCDGGSAVADLPSEKVCSVMEQLDGAFTTPTAANIFRSERDEWGCKVPGFNPYETLPTPITESEAAILINLLPVASDLRSKGSDIDWEWQDYLDRKQHNAREYWFVIIYKGPRKGKDAAPIGRFAVNKQTADVWDRDSGKQVHSREIDTIEAVLRREHKISAAWIEYYRNHPLEQGSK